jgi:hypothetical protein
MRRVLIVLEFLVLCLIGNNHAFSLEWRQIEKRGDAGSIGGYFRYYTGINPHGQFRNIPRYIFFGIALVYDN